MGKTFGERYVIVVSKFNTAFNYLLAATVYLCIIVLRKIGCAHNEAGCS